MDYKFDCRLFNGYKPCKFKRACANCPHYDPVEKRVLVISLEAMGAVLRSTCLLKPIKEKYGKCHVTWVTLKPNLALLANNPFIDRLITLGPSTLAVLQTLKFDVAFGVDKSIEAGSLLSVVNASEKFGFGVNEQGVIVPVNAGAFYQYSVGLDDELKFYQNQKTETEQLTNSMELVWNRDPYVLELTEEEKQTTISYRNRYVKEKEARVIGYNTGCSTLFPYKKLALPKAIELVELWRTKFPSDYVFLLGGPEDTERQKQIKVAFSADEKVVNTPTTEGLRKGILWENCADLVFSGCSLGMHIAIGLGKPTIAWFGLSCPQEVDLYGKGRKILADVSCSPCWKRSCDQEIKCFDQVSPQKVIDATAAIFDEIS